MLGEFEQVLLLAVLRVRENAYGVPIRDEIHACTGRLVSIGAIYRTLGRLEVKGLVTSRVGAPLPVRGGRRTRCYSLTARGNVSLKDSVGALRKLSAGLEPELGLK